MFAPNDKLWNQIHSPGGIKPQGGIVSPEGDRIAMNTPGVDPASQFGQNVASGIGQFPAFQAISPIVEYLLQMLSNQPQTKAYKSSELEGRQPIPGPNPLRQQMMGQQEPDKVY